MFEVLSDRDFHFPRYEKHYDDAEYGMSKAEFLDEYLKDAFADVQEIWDKTDPALRRELLMACQERLMSSIQEMEDEYREIDAELQA
jgi:hypothetical protein